MDPELAAQLPIILNGIELYYQINRVYLASWAFLTWDTLLCLRKELELFWFKDWSLATALYLLFRWSAWVSLSLIAFLPLNQSPTKAFCNIMFRLQAALGLYLIVLIQAILAMRVYALWGRSKIILAVLFASLIASVTTVSVMIGLTWRATSSEPVNLFAFQTCAPLGIPDFFYALWVPKLYFQATCFVLAFAKAHSSIQNAFSRENLFNVVDRHSLLYYLAMALTEVAVGIMWFVTKGNGDGDYGPVQSTWGFSIAVPGVLCTRLLLKLREAHHKAEEHHAQLGVIGRTMLGAKTIDNPLGIEMDDVIESSPQEPELKGVEIMWSTDVDVRMDYDADARSGSTTTGIHKSYTRPRN